MFEPLQRVIFFLVGTENELLNKTKPQEGPDMNVIREKQ